MIGRLGMTLDTRYCIARWCGKSRPRSLVFAVVGTWRLWRAGDLDTMDFHGRDRVGL